MLEYAVQAFFFCKKQTLLITYSGVPMIFEKELKKEKNIFTLNQS